MVLKQYKISDSIIVIFARESFDTDFHPSSPSTKCVPDTYIPLRLYNFISLPTISMTAVTFPQPSNSSPIFISLTSLITPSHTIFVSFEKQKPPFILLASDATEPGITSLNMSTVDTIVPNTARIIGIKGKRTKIKIIIIPSIIPQIVRITLIIN